MTFHRPISDPASTCASCVPISKAEIKFVYSFCGMSEASKYMSLTCK